jgi:hypothetical protein
MKSPGHEMSIDMPIGVADTGVRFLGRVLRFLKRDGDLR